MALSNDLISQFVKITKDDTKTVRETTAYGKVMNRVSDDRYYIQLDGSDVLTPVNTTAHVEIGDRVMVKIKNHSATISGNVSSPSASDKVVQGIGKDLSDLTGEYETFKGIIADEALLNYLKANGATIGSLVAGKADISELNAATGRIKQLETDNLTVNEKLTANEASISKLQTDKLDVNVANAKYATIDNLATTNASIKNLDTKKLSAEDAEIKYANIDFANIGEAAFKKIFSESGLIRDIVVGDGTITGELVGVTIKGDLIEGNTIKADKLVVKGSDGLYYKLNFEGGTFKEGEQVPTDSLHGSILTAKSVTAEKVSVKDLVAFDATIGGFNITSNAIHSNVKSSVDNTTRGIYLDNDGQMAVGDGSNFIKYFKDTDGKYKLIVTADVVRFGSSGRNLENVFNDYTTKDEFKSLEIGGRNLIKNSDFSKGTSKWVIGTEITCEIEEDSTHKQCLKMASTTSGSANCRVYPSTTENFIHTGGTYSLSFYAKADSPTTMQTNVAGGTEIVKNHSLTTSWQRFTFTYDAGGGSITFWPNEPNTVIYIAKIKMETGDKCTDWTPAPEDVDASIDDVNNHVSNTETRLGAAESLIEKLNDAISMLVTDGNGTTLLQQTTEGWKFNLYDVQSAVNSVSDSLNNLTNDIGDVNDTVDTLKEAVDKLGVISEYVTIGTHQDVLPHLHIETAYNGSTNYRIYYLTNKWTHAANTTYTLSFKARSSVSGTVLVSCVGGEYNKNSYILTTDWQPYTVTYTTTSGGSLTFWLDKANTDVDIADIVITPSGGSSSYIPVGDSSSVTNWNNTNMSAFYAVSGSNIEPCIELGEADSDFKLMITNTRIMFREGSKIPTYINTRGLVTKNIEVEEEFCHSGFVWVKRTNGNYGLSWRGDDG